MDRENITAVDFAKLREKIIEKNITPLRFLRRIEVAPDKVYIFSVTADDKDYGKIKVRRWTHEEASHIFLLPFAKKIFADQELTDEETEVFNIFKMELVYEAIVDKGVWKDKLDKEIIDQLWPILVVVSGLSEEFDKELNDFMSTDEGLGYGMLWFTVFGKLPSDIAKLPETDVKTVNTWFARWAERVKPNAGL